MGILNWLGFRNPEKNKQSQTEKLEFSTPYENSLHYFYQALEAMGLERMAKIISSTGIELGKGIYKYRGEPLIVEIKTEGGKVLSIDPISMDQAASKVGKDNLLKTLDQEKDLPIKDTIDTRDKITKTLGKPDAEKNTKEELDQALPGEGIIIPENSLKSILGKSDEEEENEKSASPGHKIPETQQ